VKTFPNHFRPAALRGYRAREHTEREDAFQQLVGDGLREDRGGDSVVAPTKGADGSIDAFVPARGEPDPYLLLPTPLIVECKDHDDELADVTRNVRAGWAKMEKKLRPKAEEGWPDTYAPWKRARGYLYCVSAVLPSQAARDQLQADIEGFFAELRRLGLCSIERVRIMDWSDLRAWLDRLPRVADHWLGVGLPGLLPQKEFVRRLSGFQQYLLEEHLPFVAPELGAQTHPDVLWQRVQAQAGTGGMLLVGPGGVGKSRTLMETAMRADRAGWRVLHALPGERALTVEGLAEEVLAGNRPTLLLLDYLDQMPNLDLESLRRRLLPAAQAKGIPFALMASARPGYLRRQVNGREELLGEPVFLRPGTSHRHAITQQVIGRIAPTAIQQLGPSPVEHICGERPIIALFIALELERYARGGRLTAAFVEDLRSGDLVSWLRRRLSEDGLTVRVPDSPFELAEPAPLLIAAALALAAAPQREEALVSALVTALQEARPATPEATARQASHLIRSLEALGWLERDGMELAAAHDVVVESVLEEVLRERQTAVVRDDALGLILSAGRTSPRTLGRLTTSLGRLVSQEPDVVQFERELLNAVMRWFDRHAQELGRALLAVPADEASYALGAVVAGVAGVELLVRHWAQVLQPWIERSGLLYEARHLLYRSLKLLPAGHLASGSLIQTALRWLEAHRQHEDATYVLGALLSRDDLGSAERECIGHAMRWVEAHGAGMDARYVLNALLARDGLGEEAPACIGHALRWLASNGQSAGGRYVLGALLERSDLREAAPVCLEHALRWLEAHGNGMDATYVLGALLGRDDLKGAAPVCIGYALRWLEAHGQSAEARFVLRVLLERGDLTEAAPACIRHALRWLELHGKEIDPTYVLGALLGRDDLKEAALACLGHAMDWLAVHGQSADARFILGALLRRDDLREAAPACLEHALRWLEVHGQQVDAQFLIKDLLARDDLQENVPEILGHAVRWLEAQAQHFEAQFIVKDLLARDDLKRAAPQIIRHAVRWLDAHGQHADATYVLGALLARSQLTEATADCISHTVRWLRSHGQGFNAQFVLKGALSRSDLKEEAPVIIGYAVRWLEVHGQSADAQFILKHLLLRSDVKDEATTIIRHAVSWLEVHGKGVDASYVLAPLLEREDLKETAAACIGHAVGWLETYGQSAEARFILKPLLLLRSGLKEAAPRVIRHAVSWLETHHQNSEARLFLIELLGRDDLKEAAHACIRLAVNWLEAHRQSLGARLLLNGLLGRDDLKEAASACIRLALHWLEAHHQTPDARFVLKDLLERSDLKEAATPCIEHALRWLEVHGQTPEARFVLKELLERSDLKEVAPACIGHALRWLDAHGKAEKASFVLQPLLARKDLGAAGAQCNEHVVRWLEEHGLNSDACYVLYPALSRRGDVDPRITTATVLWLTHHPEYSRAAALLDGVLNDRQLPDAAWQKAAELAAGSMQSRDPAGQGRLFVSLLKRPHLLGARRAELEAQAQAWAKAHEKVSTTARVLLQRLQQSASRQARGGGFANIINQVNTLTGASLQASPEFMGTALARAAREVDHGNLKLVSFSLPGLLALAARSGDPALLEQTRQLTQQVMAHRRFDARQRQSLSTACQRLLNSGAWPDRARGEKLLESLGLGMTPLSPRVFRRRGNR
jgi:arsenate reductase-like glutaredoxin family protein